MLNFMPRPVLRRTMPPTGRFTSALRLSVFAALILAVCAPTNAQFGHVLTINSEDGHFSLEADGTPVALSGDGTSASPWVANINTFREVEVANILDPSAELNLETGSEGEVIRVRMTTATSSIDPISYYHYTISTTPLTVDDFRVVDALDADSYWVGFGGWATGIQNYFGEVIIPSPAGTVLNAGLNLVDNADPLAGFIWEFQVDGMTANRRSIWNPDDVPSDGDAWIYDESLSPAAFAIRPLAAIQKLAVADIDNPTELNSETGATGAGRLCYEEMADPTAMEFTLYVMDNNTTEAQDPPYSYGGGGTNDLWIAAFGKYAQGPQTRNGTFITDGATSDIQAGDDIVATDDVFALDDLDVADDSVFHDLTEHQGIAYFEQPTVFAINPPPDTDGNSWVRWNYSSLTLGVSANGYIFTSGSNTLTDRPYWRFDGDIDAGESAKTFHWRYYIPVVASQLHGDSTQINDVAVTVEKLSPDGDPERCDVWISTISMYRLDAATWTLIGSDNNGGGGWLAGGTASPTELVATIDADVSGVKEGVWLDLEFSICDDPVEGANDFQFRIYVNGSEDSWIELTTMS